MIKDITPEPCSVTMSCPSAFEATPSPCSMGGCPTLIESAAIPVEQDGSAKPWDIEPGYFIVGKATDETVPEVVRSKVGPGEVLIWVPRSLLKGNPALALNACKGEEV